MLETILSGALWGFGFFVGFYIALELLIMFFEQGIENDR